MDNKTTAVDNDKAKATNNAADGLKSGLRKMGGMLGSNRGSAKEEDNLHRDLRKLTRTELLEMLVDETKEADRLRLENRHLRKELERCRADLEKTASLDNVIARLEQIVNRAGS